MPADSAKYLAPWEVMSITTEFMTSLGAFQVFYWDVALQREGNPSWEPVDTWRIFYQPDAPTPILGWGARVGSYNGRAVLEISNDGTDTYHKLNDVFQVPLAGSPFFVDKSALAFGAVKAGAAFSSQTATQAVRLTEAGDAGTPWTVSASAPWLQVTPASGAGSTDLLVSIAYASDLPSSGTVNGSLAVTADGGIATIISVQLEVKSASTAGQPFGSIDTPANNTTGVVGAVPFTGWALDDLEVTSVALCRAAVTGETAPFDTRCGNTRKIYVGDAVFVDGARPDVEAVYPTYPLRTRAGWGFMVLTNMLPDIPGHNGSGGVGSFTFTFYVKDRDGHTRALGTRTITCANGTSTLPFGTLDTPAQGAIVSGAAYNDFGWALTPQPKTIPVDGSTLQVFVDGVPQGHPAYGYARSDIQALFPGLNNTNAGVGFFTLDTTTLANGIHTISWSVCDNGSACTGIGSRFFGVLNGGASAASTNSARRRIDGPRGGSRHTSIATAPQAGPAESLEGVAVDTWAIDGRRGWDPSTPLAPLDMTPDGVTLLRGEELDRLEVRLGVASGETLTGYLRANGELRPLPVGASIDACTGTVTWAPGVGFVGRYDLVFVRRVNGQPTARREVRVTLAPKATGRVGLQVTLDAMPANVPAGRTVTLRGWAADLGGTHGTTGVDAVHLYAYPVTGAPIFLGAARYGVARPDVAALHGASFQASGFALALPNLPRGRYLIAAFAHRSSKASFAPATTAVLNVR